MLIRHSWLGISAEVPHSWRHGHEIPCKLYDLTNWQLVDPPWHQCHSTFCTSLRKASQVWPWLLRIHIITCHWRYSPKIIDASLQQLRPALGLFNSKAWQQISSFKLQLPWTRKYKSARKEQVFGMRADMRIPGARLGGAWMFMPGPKMSLAKAIVQRSSSRGVAGAPAICVPFFGWKFWIISSCKTQSALQEQYEVSTLAASVTGVTKLTEYSLALSKWECFDPMPWGNPSFEAMCLQDSLLLYKSPKQAWAFTLHHTSWLQSCPELAQGSNILGMSFDLLTGCSSKARDINEYCMMVTNNAGTCMWPYCWWMLSNCRRASTRSSRVSPMPTSRPLVYGTFARPAALIVSSLAFGSCKSEFEWKQSGEFEWKQSCTYYASSLWLATSFVAKLNLSFVSCMKKQRKLSIASSPNKAGIKAPGLALSCSHLLRFWNFFNTIEMQDIMLGCEWITYPKVPLQEMAVELVSCHKAWPCLDNCDEACRAAWVLQMLSPTSSLDCLQDYARYSSLLASALTSS